MSYLQGGGFGTLSNLVMLMPEIQQKRLGLSAATAPAAAVDSLASALYLLTVPNPPPCQNDIIT